MVSAWEEGWFRREVISKAEWRRWWTRVYLNNNDIRAESSEN